MEHLTDDSLCLRYPGIRVHDAVWHLPLCDATAWLLLDALSCPDGDRRAAVIAEHLPSDPPLALWAIGTSFRYGGIELTTLTNVSAWLATEGLGRLQWSGDESSSATDVVAELRCVWGRLAAESFETLQSARRRLGFRRRCWADDELALLALVGNAREWLDTCRTTAPAAKSSGPGCLPPWLDKRLGQAGDSRRDLIRDQARADPSDQTDQRAGGGDEHAASAVSLMDRWLVSDQRLVRLAPRMFERLYRLQQLENDFQQQVHREKLLSMKELAYGAGHEINNPLANISSRAQTLLRDETDPEKQRKLAAINSQAFRAHEMIADMMLFAKPPQPQRQRLDLSAVVGELIAELKPVALEQGTVLGWRDDGTAPPVDADATQLKVALQAICTNALEAVGLGGRVELQVGAEQSVSQQQHVPHRALIEIRDTGPGISAESQRHLFDPFYSGREAGRGIGFGLCKAWRIVTMHGGQIDVHSQPGAGATFVVKLPPA